MVGADAVEDHARQRAPRVEGCDSRARSPRPSAPSTRRRRRAAPARRAASRRAPVDASSPRPDAPSKSPMTPSMTAMSAPVAAVAHERRDQLGAAEERVEVAARAVGRERVVARVDVVGADLEALDDEPAARAARRSGRRRRWSCRRPSSCRRRRCAGSRAAHHSIPCCARMPGVHRMLDLDDLRRRGRRARSSSGGGVAAGDDDVLEARDGRAASRSRRRARSSPT